MQSLSSHRFERQTDLSSSCLATSIERVKDLGGIKVSDPDPAMSAFITLFAPEVSRNFIELFACGFLTIYPEEDRAWNHFLSAQSF